MVNRNRTIRSTLIKFVQNNGPQTWGNLLNVVLIMAGKPLSDRHYGSAYLDNVSFGTSALLPTDTDSSYLVKSKVDGLYHYISE